MGVIAQQRLGPQPGPQEQFLSTSADIAIYGGSAGGGKSYMLLMEPTRHIKNKKFAGIVFRRTTPQIDNPGGLLDTSEELYRALNATLLSHKRRWTFPSGAKMEFAHMQYEKDKLNFQGSQIPYIAFDELTHFTKSQFFYMLSRNRSSSGVKGYMRASCNPDPDSWVADFISWWIDQETGYPIPERAGKIRYMCQSGDEEIWGSSFEEVYELAMKLGVFNDPKLIASGVGPESLIKTVTFIPGSIFDNKIFIAKDPNYLGSLYALPAEERARLLDGNWKVRSDGMGIFAFDAINDLFTNELSQPSRPMRYITCDAARYGRDFCVIFVWSGWEIIHTTIFKKSDVHDIVKHIEELRRKFQVMKSNTLIDNDGVGNDSVKLGAYRGFKNGAPAMKDPDTRKQENYENLKTQCYYRIADKVNRGDIRINISMQTVFVFDDSKLYAHLETKIKMGMKMVEVKELIKQDLRAIKRVVRKDDKEKIKINPKEEQKLILSGRSPDFADAFMMREYFELKGEARGMTQAA